MANAQPQEKPVIIALLSLSAMLFVLYAFLAALVDKLNSVSSDLGKAIVAGAVTVIVAVISLVAGKIWEQKLKLAQDTREKKTSVYEKQVEIFFTMMFASKIGDPQPTNEEVIRATKTFTERLIVWGGPKVIRKWSDYRLHDWSNSTSEASLQKLESFLIALREDLGISNKGIKPRDFLRLFINDLSPGEQSDV